MKITTTTLAGTSQVRDVGIKYALQSIEPFADECIVICPNGPASTRLVEDCYEIVTDRLKIVEWPWQHDFSKARNAALDFARQSGAEWAFTVDDDERIELHEEDVRAVLEASSADAVLSFDEGETYMKHRAIRCSSSGRWNGITHEAFSCGKSDKFLRLTFSETSKTPDDFMSKCARDERMLRGAVAKEPGNSRLWFYLASSLHGLGDHEEAIKVYRTCAKLRGWNEESAWACYKAAQLLVSLGRNDEAIEVCAAGLRRDAGMAELPALAATAALRTGDREQARCWAELARVHSSRGCAAIKRRLGFRDPVMLADAGAAVLAELATAWRDDT